MMSSVCGFSTIRVVIASTSILSQFDVGKSFATLAKISSHITMPWRCAFDLVTSVRSLRGRVRASSNAKRMIRSTPSRVKIRCPSRLLPAARDATRPPLPGVFTLGVFADDDPVQLLLADVAQRARDAGQHARRTNVGVLVEALADRQPQSPQRDVIGHVGRADRAEVNGVEGLRSWSAPPAGIITPCFL